MEMQSSPVGDTDLAAVGAVLADPARAKILLALGDGRSLAASMLASEAGVAPSTASHHLSRLVEAGFVKTAVQGRNKYFALSGPHIGELIEAVARVAPAQPVTSLRQGTRAHAIRYARSCYDHLAGRLGVALADALHESGLLVASPPAEPGHVGFVVTASGAARFAEFGAAPAAGDVVRACLDWTERRAHVGGALGRAFLTGFVGRGWLTRDGNSRAMRLTEAGREAFGRTFGVEVT